MRPGWQNFSGRAWILDPLTGFGSAGEGKGGPRHGGLGWGIETSCRVWCLSPPSFQVSDPDGYGFAWQDGFIGVGLTSAGKALADGRLDLTEESSGYGAELFSG